VECAPKAEETCFGEEVGQVVFAWSPGNNKLLSGDAVSDPMVLHFDAFCSFWFNGVIRNTFGTFVVGKNVCGRLWVSEVFENLSKTCTVLSSQEAGDVFGFAHGGHDSGDDCGHDVDGAVYFGRVVVPEIGDAASHGAGARAR
jgi:hypothetical protein